MNKPVEVQQLASVACAPRRTLRVINRDRKITELKTHFHEIASTLKIIFLECQHTQTLNNYNRLLINYFLYTFGHFIIIFRSR